jgi:chaperonin GroES
LRPPHKPRRRVSTTTTTDGDAQDEHGADLVEAAHLQLREPAYSPKPPTPRHGQTRALEIEQEGACDQLLNWDRFGTPLQRVLAAAIYGALETRAERQGMSPGCRASQGQPGAKLMKFRPLHDRIVIRRIEGEDKTKGGIIIPDTAKEKPQEGEVIAVGPGARDESGKLVPLDVKAGDRVLFGKWSGTEVKIDGEDLLIMKESDVMGVIEGASASKKKAA